MTAIQIGPHSYTPGTSPEPEVVRAARKIAGDTQGEAACRVYRSWRGWQGYEAPLNSDGHRAMSAGEFELYLLKVGILVADNRRRDLSDAGR